MKNYIRVILMACMAISLWRCADQQPENSGPRTVQFAVHTVAPSQSSQGRTMEAYLPAGTQLLLSIQKDNGESELDHERVDLLKLSDGYISGPVALPPGTYAVTDFMLVLGDSVLYATPKAGSPLAGQVANPLPYNFTVAADEALTLDAEVLRVSGGSSTQFGYTAFNVNTGGGSPSFLLAALITDEDGQRLVKADAYILNGFDTLDHLALEPKTNTWSFTLDTAATYTLVVGRHGSMRYARSFNYTDLKEELNGRPLNVTLTPAVTVVGTYRENRLFYIDAEGSDSGEEISHMYADLGDNTGLHHWALGRDGIFEHQYAQPGTYFASINGDFDLLENFGVLSELTEIDLSALTTIPHIYFKYEYMSSIRYVKVSRKAPYITVDLDNASLPSATISEVIDDVYAGVLLNKTHYGGFTYINVATPSSEALDKLRQMRDQYDWEIIPNP